MKPTTTFTLNGVLRLTFGVRQGKTCLTEQFDQAPLKVVRPFDAGRGRILVQVINTTAGVLGGDRFLIEINVGPGAKAILVNQSATKVHRMAEGVLAAEDVRIKVESGGELEYYPGLVIPFPDSDFSQSLTVSLEKAAKFGFLNFYAMGRISRGESFAFRHLSNRTRISVDDKSAYADALELESRLSDSSGKGIMEGFCYATAGYWCWDEMTELADISLPNALLVSGRPAIGHIYLRGLARDGLLLQKLLREFLDKQRSGWGLEPVQFERYMGLLGI